MIIFPTWKLFLYWIQIYLCQNLYLRYDLLALVLIIKKFVFFSLYIYIYNEKRCYHRM